MKGVAAPSWPRVMRGQPWGCTWSVDSGKCRPGIELRNHPCGVPTSCNGREGNTVSDVNQLFAVRPCGVKDPVHVWTLYVREPGDLISTRLYEDTAGRSGKVFGLKPDVYAVEKSDIGIVPKKEPNKMVCLMPWRRLWREGRWPREITVKTSATCTQRQE